MKRILSALLCVALLATCIISALPVSAAGEDVVISATAKITDPITDEQGKMTLTLNAKENSGINTMLLKVGYNAETLRLESVTNGAVFSEANGGSLSMQNTEKNPISLLFEQDGVENITATGKIVTLVFTVVDDMGTFDITVEADRGNTFASNGKDPVDVTVGVSNEIARNTQHSTSALTNTIPPTCTEPGRIEKKCNICGKLISSVENGEPTGHEWDEIDRVEPTTTTEGEIVYECYNCGETKTEKIPMLEVKKVNLKGLYKINGDKLTLTLSLSGNTGINTLVANLGYNSEALTLDSVTNGTVFCEQTGGSMFNVNTAKNPLILFFEEDGIRNITGNGTLVTLVFTVKDANADFGFKLTVDSKNTIAADENCRPVDVPFNEPTVTEQKVMLGDINGDGRVNSIDLNLLKRVILATLVPSDDAAYASDINRDGRVNSIDLNLMKRIILATYVPEG